VSDNDSWSFVALQYYWLILNRRYLVVVGNHRIVGLRVGGAVVSPNRYTPGMDSPNPLDYIDSDLSDRYEHIDPFSDVALKMDAANFSIDRSSMRAATYLPKKWGMGSAENGAGNGNRTHTVSASGALKLAVWRNCRPQV
jgi:hypothetical protein